MSHTAVIASLIFLSAVFAVALSFPARAETTGLVVSVRDGDTLTVLDPNKRQQKIRLAGVDAPEKGQASGFRSKENLAKMVYDREVIIEGIKKDHDGSLAAKVYLDGHDIGLEQIRAGLAWWCRTCAEEQVPEDRLVYELAEKEARGRKLRLWRDPKPIPPWEWRSLKH
jgi:endonuclease YncB( thermonuclease family)